MNTSTLYYTLPGTGFDRFYHTYISACCFMTNNVFYISVLWLNTEINKILLCPILCLTGTLWIITDKIRMIKYGSVGCEADCGMQKRFACVVQTAAIITSIWIMYLGGPPVCVSKQYFLLPFKDQTLISRRRRDRKVPVAVSQEFQ